MPPRLISYVKKIRELARHPEGTQFSHTIAEQLGFVDVLRGRRARSGYDRLPSRYRLTFEPTGEGEPRTNRWASRECIEIARKLQDVRYKRAARLLRHAR